MNLWFFVPGPPQGKQRARSTRGGAHYTPDKTADYESRIGWVARIAMQDHGVSGPSDLPMGLCIVMRYPVPSQWPQWKKLAAVEGRIRPTVKPDSDNVEKAVKDALNGLVWKDDCQVVDVSTSKKYAEEPGLIVEVISVPAAPASVRNAKAYKSHQLEKVSYELRQ